MACTMQTHELIFIALSRSFLLFQYIYYIRRSFSRVLGSIFYLQYYGCDVHQAELFLPTGRDRIYPYNMAGVSSI